MQDFWLRLSMPVVLVTLFALLLWAVFSAAPALLFMLLVLLVVMIYRARQLYKLGEWLNDPLPETIPEADGLWDEVFSRLYRMVKRDDILTQKDPLTNAPVSTNGGRTLHRGVELGVSAPIADTLKLDVAFSYAKHSYDNWVTSNANFTGKEMALAPRVIANTRLSYTPGFLHGGNIAAEAVSLGSYWMDDANTTKYSGHDLLNLSASYRFGGEFELFAKVNNLTDRRFAESTNGTTSYSPGMARTFYLGIQNAWK